MQKTNKLNRLVYVEDVLKNIDRDRAYMTDVGRIHARAAVNECPTVDAKPVVHGRWEKRSPVPGYLGCSQCRDAFILEEWLADGKWSYCPNCGAKMDGDVNE